MSAIPLLAEHIAQQISEWLACGRIVPRTGKPINAGDIIIVVQRRGELVEALLQSCAKRAIPTTGLDRLRLREHIVVWDVIALADFLCDPQDDMALACLLLSPFIGMDYEALTALCATRPLNQSVWEHMQHMPEYQEVVATLTAWQALAARHLLLSPILHELLWKEGVMQRFMARCGEGVRDIVMVLLQQCTAYETSTIAPTLQEVTEWLRDAQVDIKRDLDHTQGKVRIMTVHGAKGLEAPIIILADANDVPTDKTTILPALEAHTVLAMRGGAEKYSPVYQQAKTKRAEEAEAEYWRLLYVALTRACDELHIFGKKTRRGAHASWYERVQEVMQHADNVVVHKDGMMHYGEPFLYAEEAVSSSSDAPPALPLCLSEPLPALQPALAWVAVTRLAHEATAHEGMMGVAIQTTSLSARQLGIFIHTLLEKQAGIAFASFLHALPHYMQWVAHAQRITLSAEDKHYIMGLMARMAEHPAMVALLNAPALAEASLMGMVQQSAVIAQCDRIVMTEDAVQVVDFKVAAAPATHADIPPAYRAQLQHYGALLSTLYPQKTIRTYLLYISETPCLLEVG